MTREGGGKHHAKWTLAFFCFCEFGLGRSVKGAEVGIEVGKARRYGASIEVVASGEPGGGLKAIASYADDCCLIRLNAAICV